jgi:hypothetical protein
MLLATHHSFILAQSQSISVSQSIRAAVESLGSVGGLATAAFGAILLLTIMAWRKGPMLGAVLVVFLMTMMQLDDRYFDNTLILPLQRIRDNSRVGTIAILFAMVIGGFFAPRSTRQRLIGLPVIAFFLFQTMYLMRLAFQNDPVRGGLGWITSLMILTTFTYNLGRKIEDDEGFDRFISIFGYASLIYVSANLVQLVLGYRNVVAGTRFMGISGNAQLVGYICAIFILTNVYLFGRLPLGSAMRWVYGISLGILALFLVWTGSRTGALCTTAGLVTYFRLRIGSFALVATFGAIVLFTLASVFSDSFGGVSRFLEGANTRREVWIQAWAEFRSAPIFGTIGLRGNEPVPTIESSYLSTLSLMGITGGLVLMASVFSIVGLLPRMLFLRWSSRIVPEQSDLMIASISVVLVASVFEGFFLGILSFAVVWLYCMFAMASYLIERGSMGAPDDDEFLDESGAFDSEADDPQQVEARGMSGAGHAG